MPAPHRLQQSPAGQASAEYVAVVALVAVLVAAAVAAGATAPFAQQVSAAVRTALCIVSGDVCRPADAAAEGLAPCVVAERSRTRSVEGSLFVVKGVDETT